MKRLAGAAFIRLPRTAAVFAAVFCLSTPALAQLPDTGALIIRGHPLGSPVLTENLSGPFWRTLAAVPCEKIQWTPTYESSASFRSSLLPLRQRLLKEVGGLLPPAGDIVDRVLLRTTPRYTIERIRFVDRVPESTSYAYLVTPLRLERPSAAVVLLHGSGIHPQEAFGWKDEYRPLERFTGSTFVGSALELAEAGYVVLVPWLADDELSDFWPRLQWQFVERAGSSLRARTNGAGAYHLLVNEILGGVDFLQALPSVDGQKIAIMGWAEGSALASMAAAVDPRLRAVVRLEAPLNRSALRATADGVQGEAQFTHADCTLGDVEMSALIAPRPILFAWSGADQSVSRFARFFSSSIVAEIRAIYGQLRVPGSFNLHGRTAWSEGDARAVRQWVDGVLAFNPRPMPDSVAASPQPATEQYHAFPMDSVREPRRQYAAALGPCVSHPFRPDYKSLAGYLASVAGLRSRVARELGVALPGPATLRITQRSLVSQLPDYRLEFIAAVSSRTSIPLSGLLATPATARGTRPVVISLDGNVDLGQPLGLPVPERTPYLNAYARGLVSAGNIVFIPFVPVDFPEVSAAELKARGAAGMTSMSLILPLHFASVDLVRALRDVDTSRVAIRGISYAGIAALYTAALDTRISALLYSNPVLTGKVLFEDPTSAALAAWWPELCSTIDLTHTYLIAPRSFVRENGLRDANGYEDAPLETIDWVRTVYESLGISRRFQFVRHDGGHETRIEDIPLFVR